MGGHPLRRRSAIKFFSFSKTHIAEHILGQNYNRREMTSQDIWQHKTEAMITPLLFLFWLKLKAGQTILHTKSGLFFFQSRKEKWPRFTPLLPIVPNSPGTRVFIDRRWLTLWLNHREDSFEGRRRKFQKFTSASYFFFPPLRDFYTKCVFRGEFRM